MEVIIWVPVMAVTTAEDAHGALELLGLADGQQNFSNTVSQLTVSRFCQPHLPLLLYFLFADIWV